MNHSPKLSPSPKYQSFFIINKKRQYQKTSNSTSLDTQYKSARDNLQSAKRLSVTSRCHKIIWDKNKQNITLGGVKNINNYSFKKPIQQSFTKPVNQSFTKYANQSFTKHVDQSFTKPVQSQNDKYEQNQLQNNDLRNRNSHIDNLDNTRYRVDKGYEQITKSLYNNDDLAKNNNNLQILIPSTIVNDQLITSQYYQYPLSFNQTNINQQQSNQSQIVNNLDKSLNNSIHSNNSNNKLKSNSTSSKHSQNIKSKLKLLKQQFNNTLQQQSIIQSQVINNNNFVIINNANNINNNNLNNNKNEQQLQLKSFTKDQLCSSFYGDDQHLPHKLIINSARRGIDNNYAMTVHQNINRSNIYDSLSKTIRPTPRNQLNTNILKQRLSTQINNQHNQSYNITNINTHQSQMVIPTKHSLQRHSQQLPIHVISPSNNLNTLKNTSGTLQIPINNTFQKVVDLNPKPCQSFIIDASGQQNENKLTKAYYEQERKRREQADDIFKSLMNMKMIHQTIE